MRRLLPFLFFGMAAGLVYGQGSRPPPYYLSQLLDVGISSPANSQVLTYDSATGKWKNANAAIAGTVTDFSAGDLSPLFTTTEATTTTTPALSFSLTSAGANTVFGRAAGTSGAPTYSSSPQFTAIGNLTSNGFVKTGGGVGALSIDTTSYEPALGNPGTSGFVLSSTTAGVRSWIAQSGGGASVADPGSQLLGLTKILGSASTAMRSDGAPALDQSIAPTWTAKHIFKFGDASNNVADVITVTHNNSNPGSTSLGTGIQFSGKDSTTADTNMAEIQGRWSSATHGSQTGYLQFNTVNSTVQGIAAVISGTDGLSVGSGAAINTPDGVIDARTGFRVSGVATTGTILQGNGTNYVASTPTWPTAAGTAGNVVKSDGTNFVSAADPGPSAPETLTLTDAVTAAATTILTLDHESSGTPTTDFGTKILIKAKDSTTANVDQAWITAQWQDATHASRRSYMDFGLDAAGGGPASAMRLFQGTAGQGALNVGGTSDPGSNGVISANSGYQVALAAATGKILQGNGTIFTASTPTWPTTAGTSGNVVLSNGSNFTSSQLNFSNLAGNWTLAQGPSITAAKLLGRTDASAGIPQEITLGTNLSMSGTTLNATGGAGGSPGGSNTQVQFNDSGAFGGDADFVWDKTANKLSLNGTISTVTTNSNLTIQPNGTGWLLVNSNNAFVSPPNNNGVAIGWNYSSGSGEVVLQNTYNGASGAGDNFRFCQYGNAQLLDIDGNGGLKVPSTGGLYWANNTGILSASDTGLYRNAAGVVEINNGTAGQFRDLTLRAFTASNTSTIAILDTETAGASNPGLIVAHNSTGTPAANLGAGVSWRAETTGTGAADSQEQGRISSGWSDANNNTRTGYLDFLLTNNAAAVASKMRLFPSGGLSVNNTTDPGAGIVSANTGLWIGAAAPGSGKILQSDGAAFKATSMTWPTASGASGYDLKSDGTNIVSYPEALFNSNTVAQSSLFSADTYITNSNVTVAAGDWKAKGVYRCRFDMSKSGAGTAAPVLTVRIGTNASTADTAILTFTLGAGTAVADTSIWDLSVNFRSVGSGTSAVVQGTLVVQHTAATGTGITSTADKSLTPFTLTTSSGFASNAATQLGCSFNGGSAFSGTVQQVTAALVQP